MSATNTPRPDAVLKNLPKERQHEIWLRRTEGPAEQRSQAAIRKWLADDGIKVGSRAVSQFLSWYADQLELQESNDTLEAFEEFLRKQKKDWTADKIRDTAIQFFISQTVGKKDVNQFATVVQLDQNERFGRTSARLKERDLALKESKFQFDAAKAALAAVKELRTISASKLSDVEKIDAARRQLFGELPEDLAVGHKEKTS
jgi:hypothetical protein